MSYGGFTLKAFRVRRVYGGPNELVARQTP